MEGEQKENRAQRSAVLAECQRRLNKTAADKVGERLPKCFRTIETFCHRANKSRVGLPAEQTEVDVGLIIYQVALTSRQRSQRKVFQTTPECRTVGTRVGR